MYAVATSPAVTAGAPVTRIRCDPPAADWDTGLTVCTSTEPTGPDLDMTGYCAMHIDCLVDDQPGLEAGLHLALDHGAAHLVDGHWLPDHDDQPTPHNGHGQLRGL